MQGIVNYDNNVLIVSLLFYGVQVLNTGVGRLPAPRLLVLLLVPIMLGAVPLALTFYILTAPTFFALSVLLLPFLNLWQVPDSSSFSGSSQLWINFSCWVLI